jgi:hypothetical protein
VPRGGGSAEEFPEIPLPPYTASEEAFRRDLAVIHQQQREKLREVRRELLNTPAIDDEPVEPDLGALRQQEALKHVVARDVEGARCVDLLYCSVQLSPATPSHSR